MGMGMGMSMSMGMGMGMGMMGKGGWVNLHDKKIKVVPRGKKAQSQSQPARDRATASQSGGGEWELGMGWEVQPTNPVTQSRGTTYDAITVQQPSHPELPTEKFRCCSPNALLILPSFARPPLPAPLPPALSPKPSLDSKARHCSAICQRGRYIILQLPP